MGSERKRRTKFVSLKDSCGEDDLRGAIRQLVRVWTVDCFLEVSQTMWMEALEEIKSDAKEMWGQK